MALLVIQRMGFAVALGAALAQTSLSNPGRTRVQEENSLIHRVNSSRENCKDLIENRR